MTSEMNNIDSDVVLEAIKSYLSGEASTCSYCDRIEPLILVHGVTCYVTLAIGQIVEGYTQVTTYAHRTAITGLLSHEAEEFWQLVADVRESYLELYGTRGVAFEHGEAANCLWGSDFARNQSSLCHHVHLHLVPVDVDITAQVASRLGEPFVVESPEDLRRLRVEELHGEPYLYFQDAAGHSVAFPVTEPDALPRQYLRTAVAAELGLQERANWIEFPGEDLMAASKPALEDSLMRRIARRADS